MSIERTAYLGLRASLLDVALRRANDLAAFYDIPFERYAPVRRQLLMLLRRVNEVRHQAGLAPIPADVLGLRRRVVKPFGETAPLARAA